MKLNIGCGNKRKEGYIGVDRYPCEAADVLCDVTSGLSFGDAAATAVYMDNFIEHVLDIPALMTEVVRVCRHDAEVTVITPHFSSLASWNDPTHVHHLSYFSFDHFEKPSVQHYMGGGLSIIERRLSFGGGLAGLIARALFRISPESYERKYCFIFRASTLTCRFRVVKERDR